MAKANRSRASSKERPETAEKRREILAAATEVFGAKGYSKATLQEVAELVGMTHAGVLHYFGSKRNLLLETVRYRDISDVGKLATQQLPMGREQFDHLVATAFQNCERPGIVQAFAVFSTEALTDDSPVRDYYLERYRIIKREISTNFRELCVAEGIAEPATIDYGAAAIIAVMDGLQYQWLLDPDNLDLGRATEFAIGVIVDAVLGRQTSD